jgi:hypothetical protein
MNLYVSKPLGKEHGTFTFIQRRFKKQVNRDTDAKNFILSYICIWHMDSRWYTSGLHIVNIDIFGICHSIAPSLVLPV